MFRRFCLPNELSNNLTCSFFGKWCNLIFRTFRTNVKIHLVVQLNPICNSTSIKQNNIKKIYHKHQPILPVYNEHSDSRKRNKTTSKGQSHSPRRG